MFGEDLIIRTKLIPPRLKPQILSRPRLTQLLNRCTDYPLTIVKADAGYGKSTTLASFLAQQKLPYLWYSLAETDADPLVFLVHVIYALRMTYPNCGERALSLLEQEGGAAKLWAPAVDALTNELLDLLEEEMLLVLDDYHVVDRPEVNAITERLIEHMPPRLHLVLATRHTPMLPSLARWRAHREVLEISKRELAFTPQEVAALFSERYGCRLTGEQTATLAEETEGWIIALQLIGQQVQSGTEEGLEQLLRRLPDSLGLAFDYLAEEVLAKQPAHIQEFLIQTAILRQLHPPVCDQLTNRSDSAMILRYLDEHSLFVVGLGPGAYRYHHLFHDFLKHRMRAQPERWRALHRRAAEIAKTQGELEEAIYHFIEAGEMATTALLLEEVAEEMVRAGRYETLAAWLDRLPQAILDEHPTLLVSRGDCFRLTSRFQEALELYKRAQALFAQLSDPLGQSRALLGQALIYLDTVQPARAAPLLKEALRLVGKADLHQRAQLLVLSAENKINYGQLRQAERLHRAVYRACQGCGIAEIDPRLYVRMGRLAEARALLERDLHQHPSGMHQRMPRSHRESAVLLSWISAFMGEGEAARRYAEMGLRLGKELHSPIVECVALARLGHGWLTGPDFDCAKALEFYQQSLELSKALQVPRFGVEARLGFTVAYGLQGRFPESERWAHEGLVILHEAGDRYLASVLWLAVGAAGVLTNHAQAQEWLERAQREAEACGDRYGPCVAHLWKALLALRVERWEAFDREVHEALAAAQAHGYDFLFTRQPLLGPKDLKDLMALLCAARHRGLEVDYVINLLRELTKLRPELAPSPWPPLTVACSRPYPPLYVQTLGAFRVWRGEHEIAPSTWGREKALQLFQLLISHRDRPIHREQILEALWPDAYPAKAKASLRVALNALHRALEPTRHPHQQPFYVRYRGELLWLNPEAQVLLDADEFMRLIEEGHKIERHDPARALSLYRRALALYQGDYLPTCLYEDWAKAERERLLTLYLTTAAHLAELLTQQGAYEEAGALCHQILAKDPCWEEAYYLLMLGHFRQGNRSLAIRTYERCVKRLREQLGVEPSPRTRELFQTILSA
ncbi:MAG: BTAD domain-containing putative transcriptional regulator [Candidatus Bipolaricaulia bacterium]